jgi:hypothetical protein
VLANLLASPHTGFGAHVSREIPAGLVSREIVARYLAHPPIILGRIVGDPSAGKVIYTREAIHGRPPALSNFLLSEPATRFHLRSHGCPLKYLGVCHIFEDTIWSVN